MECKTSKEYDGDERMFEGYCIDMEDMPLGIAYVPWQEWRSVMEADEGMKFGTVFAELVMPFYGKKGVRENCGCPMTQAYGVRYEGTAQMKTMAYGSAPVGSANVSANARGRRCGRV